jgi:DNA-directed RNA polymerase sigma subunit (sigma70/sigma32)
MPPISRERVRQIEAGAFKKIRESCKDLLSQFLTEGFATGA